MGRDDQYSLGWRDCHKPPQGRTRAKYLKYGIPRLLLYSGCFLVGLLLVFAAGFWILGQISQVGYSSSKMVGPPEPRTKKLPEEEVTFELNDLNLDLAHIKEHFVVEKGGVPLTVEFSVDPRLQDYILGLLQRSKTFQAAVVVLKPNDGRILAMVSYNEEGNGQDLCLRANFPAASLFKIVSAAAALESAGFTPDRSVFFQGRKHTLYKGQLKQIKGMYTTKTSFRKAFASSINPVFGKIGIYYLGQKVITDTAEKFLFNQTIPFDLPVAKSMVHVPNDDFGLAEVASGFNKNTMISPLHAALLTSAVVNNGIIMTPWLVKRVSKADGDVLYQSKPARLTTPISRDTAENLRILMQDTVQYGTCRRSFRRMRKKKAFKDMELGAKTGTINDRGDQFKYDWLAAYVLLPNGVDGISIAVLGIHGKRLGIRANELGRHIINYYVTS